MPTQPVFTTILRKASLWAACINRSGLSEFQVHTLN